MYSTYETTFYYSFKSNWRISNIIIKMREVTKHSRNFRMGTDEANKAMSNLQWDGFMLREMSNARKKKRLLSLIYHLKQNTTS
jgi:hypothetical protein